MLWNCLLQTLYVASLRLWLIRLVSMFSFASFVHENMNITIHKLNYHRWAAEFNFGWCFCWLFTWNAHNFECVDDKRSCFETRFANYDRWQKQKTKLHIRCASEREFAKQTCMNANDRASRKRPSHRTNEISVKAETSFMRTRREVKQRPKKLRSIYIHLSSGLLDSHACQALFFFCYFHFNLHSVYMQNRKPHDNDDWLARKKRNNSACVFFLHFVFTYFKIQIAFEGACLSPSLSLSLSFDRFIYSIFLFCCYSCADLSVSFLQVAWCQRRKKNRKCDCIRITLFLSFRIWTLLSYCNLTKSI